MSFYRLVHMFRCQMCRRVVLPRIPSHRLVLKWRSKVYPFRSEANVFYRKPEANKKRKRIVRDDPGGRGKEIVQEVRVCPECTAKNGQI
jgi:hypothetical protein